MAGVFYLVKSERQMIIDVKLSELLRRIDYFITASAPLPAI